METLKIDILDPKAKKLLEDLADLRLINIQAEDPSKKAFYELLNKLRIQTEKAPSLEEIQKEVEAVRKKRYDQS